MNLKLCLSIFLLMCGLNFPSSFAIGVNGGGSKVVSGDAFGKFYGKGVGSLSGWNESNPFGINTVMSGPTTRYCPKSNSDRPDREPASTRRSRSSNDDREDGGSNAPLLVTAGSDLESDRNYAEGMEGAFQILRDNAKFECESNDYSTSSCRTKVIKVDNKDVTVSSTKEEHDSLGRCWKYVKMALKESNLVDEYISSNSAIDAHRNGILKDKGFCELNIANSNQAPIGSIIVYEWTEDRASSKGTRAPEYGHIEIRTGEKEFISDFVSDEPIDQKTSNVQGGDVQRKFAAAYVPGPCASGED